MKILRDEIVYDGKFIRTIRRHFLNTAGKPHVWEMVERKTYGRIVAIAAITPKKEIILEKTFRIPLKSYVFEFPAGLMDKKGESEKIAIRRELLEETGYVVDKVRLLYAGPFNTGMIDDRMAVYLGTNARKIAEPKPEPAEDITVVKVPLKNLLNFLSSQKRVLCDIKIPAVLPYLEKEGLLR